MTNQEIQIELNKQAIEVLKEGLQRQEGVLKEIKDKNEQMFNHFTERYEQIFKELSNRLPRWAVFALGLLCTIIGAIASGVVSAAN